jgi:aminodeoxyfutalosine deaminase
MSDFYRQLRKAELHVHLEGSVEPETVLELDPSLTIDQVREKYAHTDFEGFIQSYVWINRLLRTPSDYALILKRLLESLNRQNVVYAEINLSVGMMLWKGQQADAIFEALCEQASRSPVRVGWIFDAVRQFGAEPSVEVAKLAVKYRDAGVVGFGIGGDEVRGPAGMFADVFAFAKDERLAILPHAGETAGAESIRAAIECGAKRIGHGIRAADDPALMSYLRDHDIPLEICISSNVCTGAVASLAAHPVRRLFEAGVPITLNSDDPAMFRTTLSNEYQIAAERFGFSEAELRGIAENAFRYALGYFQGAR